MLVATGARANDDLAAAAGLPCEDGIVVDDFASAAPGVYAIGDCARFFSHRYGRRIRLECVQNAIDQAKAAASAILGKPAPYDPVPWFWSDQYEIKLQITGLLDGYDACETVGLPAESRFSVEYRKAGKLDRGGRDQRRPRPHARPPPHRRRSAGSRYGAADYRVARIPAAAMVGMPHKFCSSIELASARARRLQQASSMFRHLADC